MTEYRFDLSRVRSLEDWWDQYTQVVNGLGAGHFGRNRDAYRDSLCGGPGAPMRPCRFTFVNAGALSRDDVLAATTKELEQSRAKVHPTNLKNLDARLALLSYGVGETILNWILDPVIEAGIELTVKPGA
jgi:hypothetical protein